MEVKFRIALYSSLLLPASQDNKKTRGIIIYFFLLLQASQDDKKIKNNCLLFEGR